MLTPWLLLGSPGSRFVTWLPASWREWSSETVCQLGAINGLVGKISCKEGGGEEGAEIGVPRRGRISNVRAPLGRF